MSISSDSAPPSSTKHDVVVVGNGPIGSAIARHVAETGRSVLVLDGRDTLTSASDDMGRIVRPLDAEGRRGWTQWNIESIEAFPEMERKSGVRFFRRCGSLACGTEAFVREPRRRLSEAGVVFQTHDSGEDVCEKFPYLSVPRTHVGVSDGLGGFVDPQKMIRAQNALMAAAAGERSRASGISLDAAIGIDGSNEKGAPVTVRTRRGATLVADFVILAGGAYTRWLAETSGLLDFRGEQKQTRPASRTTWSSSRSGVRSIRNSRRTVLLAEVTETEALGALRDMPCVKYEFADSSARAAESSDDASRAAIRKSRHSRNEAVSVYVLPPILYPGPDPPRGWYVKIGGGANDFFREDQTEDAEKELETWMRGEGDETVADTLHDVLLSLMPFTNFLSVISEPCVTTCTDDGELQCDVLGVQGNVAAVSGCQGKAAGPADAIGRAVVAELLPRRDDGGKQ
jgi:sarcosine oxidase